jgi:hypothetical protein
VITAFHIPRAKLTEANVIRARNEYAKGCALTGPADPRLVGVKLYASWPLGF